MPKPVTLQPVTIDFIFDFGSPNAYLSWKLLPAVAARTGAAIKLIPCLLGGIFKYGQPVADAGVRRGARQAGL